MIAVLKIFGEVVLGLMLFGVLASMLRWISERIP